MRRVVVDLRSPSPAFRLPDAAADRLRAATLRGWETVVVGEDNDALAGSPSGPGPEAMAAVAEAVVYFGWGMPAPLFHAAPKLRWSEIGVRFAALGAQVAGLRRVPAKGCPPGFSSVAGLEALDAELRQADVVVLAAALTGETRDLLDARRLALLPQGAIVVNVSRGTMLDEEALHAALVSGHLRGAVLDVFAREPLAPASPLWQLRQVLVTPHVSGVSPRRLWDRLTALFLANWQAYAEGRPLRNLVDKALGY